MIFIEPEDVFAVRRQPSAHYPVADMIDRTESRILETLRERGTCKLWTFLSILVEREGTSDRGSACRLRLELLQRVRILRSKGLVYGVGRNSIALEKPTPKPRLPRTWKWKRSVAQKPRNQAMRAPIRPSSPTVNDLKDQVGLQIVSQAKPRERSVEQPTKTQSASDSGGAKWQPFSFQVLLAATMHDPAAEEVSTAASVLARRPRNQAKKWSGFLDPKNKATRLWRGRQLVTPEGQIVNAVGCLRGLVLVEWADPLALEGRSYQVFKAPQLGIFKNPAAVFLGRRKQNKKERPSSIKSETARRNGQAPCRTGSRPRGRPRTFPRQAQACTPGPSTGTNI